MTDRFVHAMESLIFGLRWLLAPLYVGLALGIVAIMVKFGQEVYHLLHGVMGLNPDENAFNAAEVTIRVLELVDMTLLGNLTLLVMFVGYENFVSRLDTAEGADRPEWLGKVDFAGLKLKLIGSLVAISAIALLSDFIKNEKQDLVVLHIAIHMTFVISGIAFAFTERIDHKPHKAS